MISVIETWYLKPDLAERALELMQEMDDLVGPPAHAHPGWCGHAQFYQSQESPSEILMVYPWRSADLHADLLENEEELLQPFYGRYCARPRSIRYFDELPVDVDGAHDH